MRSLIFGFFSLGFIMLAAQQSLYAARDLTPAASNPTSLELVVFESPRCDYCPLIRSNILPAYQRSSNAKDVPMRFVNLDAVDTNAMGLSTPLRIMPTIVLMNDGAEVDRISGYVAPQMFFHAFSRMIGDAQN